jgi:hypothetical protein
VRFDYVEFSTLIGKNLKAIYLWGGERHMLCLEAN